MRYHSKLSLVVISFALLIGLNSTSWAAKVSLQNCSDKEITVCAYNGYDLASKYSQTAWWARLEVEDWAGGHCSTERCKVRILPAWKSCNSDNYSELWSGKLGSNSYVFYDYSGSNDGEGSIIRVNDSKNYIREGRTCESMGY